MMTWIQEWFARQMQGLANSLDFIIDTASGDHLFDPLLSLLKIGGVLVLVGFPNEIKLSPPSNFMGTVDFLHQDVYYCLRRSVMAGS